MSAVVCGQDEPRKIHEPPKVDLLKLDGSTPNLAANSEGIVSYKTDGIFQRGVTKVRQFDSDFKIELPTGYTLFNNLAYIVESKAVIDGPNDVAFSIPSATRREQFDQLRILYAAYDQAEPEKPLWIDITVGGSKYPQQYLSKVEYEKRLPDFNTHTLHAFTEDDPVWLVVALKDSKIARDNFSADLSVAVSAPESVMEGREIKQVFVVTNNGPDAATAVSFSSGVDPQFVALTSSQGVCRWYAHNIYCNLGRLQKGESATITNEGSCDWDRFSDTGPVQRAQGASAYVYSREIDPEPENNDKSINTTVIKDPNKAPRVEIVSPAQDQFFVGPKVSMKLQIRASDPDGTISKLELYDRERFIGVGELKEKDQYELNYEATSYGRHTFAAVATDNQGRPTKSYDVDVHVNGQAQIKFLSPTPNQVMKGPVRALSVRARVNDPGKIEKVVFYLRIDFGGTLQTAIIDPGTDEYASVFKDVSVGASYTVSATVTDAEGVETLSSPISFRITEPPQVDLSYSSDGKYRSDLVDGITLDGNAPIMLFAFTSHSSYERVKLGTDKVEFYVDGQRMCVDVNKTRDKARYFMRELFECNWKPKPGTHVLSAIATNNDGVVGKSKAVEVVIR